MTSASFLVEQLEEVDDGCLRQQAQEERAEEAQRHHANPRQQLPEVRCYMVYYAARGAMLHGVLRMKSLKGTIYFHS